MNHRTWLTPRQVADRTGLSVDFIYAQLRAGRLRGSFIGRKWWIEDTAIDAFYDAHSNDIARPRRRRQPA